MRLRGTSLARSVICVAALLLAWLPGAFAQGVLPTLQTEQTREMLDLYGVTVADLQVISQEPTSAERELTLLRTLYAVGRFDRLKLHRLSQAGPATEELESQPDDYRGGLFQYRGTLTECAEITLPADIAARFEMPRYFRCKIRLSDTEAMVVVYTPLVPQAWLGNTTSTLAEPVSFTGLLAGISTREAAQFTEESEQELATFPTFISKRLAWHPSTTLGKLGMDVGLLDAIRQRTPLRAEETEAFYSLLAAAGRTELPQLLRLAQDDYSVTPLFNAPELQVGRLVALSGVARRAIPIIVDPATAERFGIEQYYELEVVTPDSQGNPLTFCVLQLPPGMPTGEDIYERVRIPGFFLKAWTFRSQELQEQARAEASPEGEPGEQSPAQMRRQIAPLLIGKEPLWFAPTRDPFFSTAGMVAGGAFLALLAAVWAGLWYISRLNRHYDRQTLSRVRHGAAAPAALDELMIQPEPQSAGPQSGDDSSWLSNQTILGEEGETDSPQAPTDGPLFTSPPEDLPANESSPEDEPPRE